MTLVPAPVPCVPAVASAAEIGDAVADRTPPQRSPRALATALLAGAGAGVLAALETGADERVFFDGAATFAGAELRAGCEATTDEDADDVRGAEVTGR